jgi:hypothetical protein
LPDGGGAGAGGDGAAAATVIVAIALLPSLVTVIGVVPALTAVTNPAELTEAIPGFALDELTTRPVNGWLLASNADTWSWTVAPLSRVADAGVTVTDSTGADGGGKLVVAADATFERGPYTAFRFIVPRNATSWKL